MTLHPYPSQLVEGDTVTEPAGERTVVTVATGTATVTVRFTDGSVAVFDRRVPLTRGALAAHLIAAHHVATVPATPQAEHLHRVLHDTRLIRLDHHHEGASL